MNSFLHLITVLLSLGTLVADVGLVLFICWFLFDTATGANGSHGLALLIGEHAVGIGLFISTTATLGSLFFSNIVGYAPCELCWWQRVCLYPQVVIFAVALAYQRRGRPLGPVFSASGILSLIGLLIGLFQYYGATWNAGALAACGASGVSCAKTYFVEFGYITIPVMALTASALLLATALARRSVARQEQ